MAKSGIDWEKIEIEYRAGVLSSREIATMHGISHTAINKKAAKLEWTRNLHDKIIAKSEEILARQVAQVSETVAKMESGEGFEHELATISANAEAIAHIKASHRKDIADLRRHEERLLNELEHDSKKLYITTYKGGIVEQVVDMTVAEKASTLNALSSVRERRINLERGAWGIEIAKSTEDIRTSSISDIDTADLIAIIKEAQL